MLCESMTSMCIGVFVCGVHMCVGVGCMCMYGEVCSMYVRGEVCSYVLLQ